MRVRTLMWSNFQTFSESLLVVTVQFRRMSMMGELTKMGCSMIGAWGPASAGGGLLQLRALDWDTDGPFQAFPLLIVRHPSAPE